MPRYVHGDALTNFTVEWLNGDFEFELQVLWNSSDVSALNLQGSYSSPIYLGATKKYVPLQKNSSHEIFDVDGEFISIPSLDIDPVVKRAPIILFGTYSADGKSFLWSGNVSAVIPDAIPVTPWSSSSYWSNSDGAAQLEHMPWVPRNPAVQALPATAGASSALGVSVTSGNVTVISDGTVANWWDGKLPVAIPMPAFNRVVNATSKKAKMDKGKIKPSYASGLVWDASFQRKDNVTLNLQGNYSLPIFVHGPGALFDIDWKIGNFSLDFKLLWNATLDEVFQEGRNYSSPIFFREAKPSDTPTDIIVGMQGAGSVEGSADLQFAASGVADAYSIAQAPIILLGSFSPDKTQFLWSGNATVILPSPTGPVQLQMSVAVPPPVESADKVRVGAEVIGGSIDAGKVGSTQSTVWNGELPVPIRRLDLLARGITWNGQLTSTKLAEAQLEGTFLTVIPEDGGSTFPISPYQGKFSLQLGLLWNVFVDGLLSPEIPVYSPIYFHGAAASDDSEAWFAVDADSSHSRADLAHLSVDHLRVPIILQGAYSADLTTFWWSGRVILAFPPVSLTKMQQLIRTKPRFPPVSKPPLGNSFMVMPTYHNSISPTGAPRFRPLRLGAFVSSGSITTSAGTAWSGKLPLQLSLPLFDSAAGTDGSPTDVSEFPPAYAHGILWEGTLSSSYAGYMTFNGEFSMPRYVHGGKLSNFSIQWINGRFNFELQVLWNTSDIANLDIQGLYSSPVFVGPRQKYSHLQDVPYPDYLSDVSGAIKMSPSLTPTPSLKKAPITLLGSYSSDGMSFIWSGNVSLVIPDVIPIPTWTENAFWSEINGAYPPGQLTSSLRSSDEFVLPAASSALGVTVTNANVSVISNGSYVSWWNGTLPLSIPLPAMKNELLSKKSDKYSKVKPKPSYATKLIWNATLKREDNVKLRLAGNFSVPIFVKGPSILFNIDWKTGNFSFDFKLLWNTSLDDVIQKGKNYYSPVFVRTSKPSDTISDIITDIQRPNAMNISHETAFSSDSSAFGRAPIILHGIFSSDNKNFLWFGNATIILPKPTGPVLLEIAATPPGNEQPISVSRKRVTLGAEVLDGDLAAGPSGTALSQLWSGEIPVPIRHPELLARGVTWKGEFTENSATEVQLTGSFSALWTSVESSAFPFSVYDGKFSAKLSLLWNVSVTSLLPAGATVYSPVYLRGTTVPNVTGGWLAEVENNPQTMAAELAQPQAVAADLRVPIILQGTYSPDLTTFWWTGRVILAFPQPPPPTMVTLQQLAKYSGNSIGATVTTGSVTAADGSKLWDGSLPLVLPAALQTVVWNGALTPSVGGTVELRGSYYGRGGSGAFALVLSPLWSTPLAGHVVPGTNYTSPLFLREPGDPAPRTATAAVSGGRVPVILQGSFAPDKSSFSWSGNVIVAFP